MTREEAIRELKADYCGNRIICELYPDQCNREDCEIWLAIKALEIQPDGDAVSRRTVIETVKDADVCVCYSENESVEIENVIDLAVMATKRSVIAIVEQMPSAQPERIKGHWVEIASSNHTYKCSVCGRLLVNITDGKNNVAKNYPYCHCGADMRGEQE